MHLFATFPKFVDDELQRRRSSRRAIQNTKSPWMRMTSNFKPANGAERRVLMGGDIGIEEGLRFGFANLYETRSVSGEKFRPVPGIESITVDSQLESFECTVEWTANSIGQLERLFPYFMNLGTTVIVDWGWDDVPSQGIIDVSNEDEVKSFYQNLGNFTDQDPVPTADGNKPSILSRYQTPRYKQLEKANGRYGFVAGTVVDFSYTPEGNSQYSCTTEITSVSKAMTMLRNRKQKEERSQENEDQAKNETIGATIKLDLFQYFNLKFRGQLEKLAEDGGDVVKVSEVGSDINRRTDAPEGNTYYVSWKKIEEIVNDYSTHVAGNVRTFEWNSAASIISNFNAGDYQTENGKPPLNLRTLDPLICVVDSGGQSNGKFRQFSKQNDAIKEAFNDDSPLNDTRRQGFMYNLYIEYQLVVEAFEKKETVMGAMKYMLNLASKACFDIWDFKVVSDTNTFRVIDRNMTQSKAVDGILNSSSDEFEFQPNTRLSILRDFSFDTNMADLMKSQIIVQSNAKREGSNKNAAVNSRDDSNAQFFKGAFPGQDLVLGELGKPKESEASKEESPEEQNFDRAYEMPRTLEVADEEAGGWFGGYLGGIGGRTGEDARKSAVEAFYDSGPENLRGLVYLTEQTGGASLAQTFSAVLQADDSPLSGINGNNTLNINAQLTLDGIGGFCAFQTMKIKNIPRVFESEGIFTIDSVTHNVSTDDWTTELKTSFVLQNKLNPPGEGTEKSSGNIISQERFDEIRNQGESDENGGGSSPPSTEIPGAPTGGNPDPTQ